MPGGCLPDDGQRSVHYSIGNLSMKLGSTAGTWLAAFVAVAPLLDVSASNGHAQVSERVLKNLVVLPSDPLPPVRANKPSAAEMSATPKQHPYLFFTANERQTLRARITQEPFRALADRLRVHAEDCLKREIPASVDFAELPPTLADGSINPAWLKQEYYDPFYKNGYLVREVVSTLAFAYQLTGERRFGEAAKTWVLDFARRPKLSTKLRAADFETGNLALGLALGYDWLWDLLEPAERQQVRQALAKLMGPTVADAREMLAFKVPQMQRGYMGGNHRRRTHGLFGIIPLTVLYEVPEAKEWLDLEIQLNRDRLYPSALAPNGENMEAWDHFNESFHDAMMFTVALQHMEGEDLFQEPNLRQRFRELSHFFLYGLEEIFHRNSYDSAWLALASHARDPVAQWLVTRNHGLAVANEVFAYLFYDPTIAATPPVNPAGSLYFPYSGMVKMCSDWSPKGLLIPFRCGPEIPKDRGDQNAFRLRVDGEWALPRLERPKRKPGQPPEFDDELERWFCTSPAQNIILPEPDGISDAAVYDRTSQLAEVGGLQYSEVVLMKGRERNKQWLSGPEIPKRGELRVVHLDEALDYVCGEAHRAYAYFTPKLWLRHILFVKGQTEMPAYILVCDEVEAGTQPRTFAWQLHSGWPMAVRGNNVVLQGKKADVDVCLLNAANDPILQKLTPAPFPADRTPFIQWTTPAPREQCHYLTALVPHNKASTSALSFRVLEAEGGWAVEVTAAGRTDVALFRSDHAASVSAGGISSTGTAALYRKRGDAQPVLYLLGNP
jgi:Domain of unknown function (DUF4962)